MKKKLSELTFESLVSVGLKGVAMPTDCSDCVSIIDNEGQFDRAQKELMARYGDVDIVITPDAAWYDRLRIDDRKWEEDHKRFVEQKAAWCAKYGCD